MVPRAAPRAQRARARRRDPLLQLPRHDAARRRPGRRLALRRRRRDGAAGRRRRRGAERCLRGRPRRAGGSSCWRPPGASSTRRSPASWRPSRELALLCGRYEGVDERVARAPRHRRRLDRARTCSPAASWRRWWSPTRCSASSPARWATPTARSRSRSREALGGAPEYPHYTRPASYRGWEVPEVLLSGDHARVREWRLEQSRRRAGARLAARGSPLLFSGRAGLR